MAPASRQSARVVVATDGLETLARPKRDGWLQHRVGALRRVRCGGTTRESRTSPGEQSVSSRNLGPTTPVNSRINKSDERAACAFRIAVLGPLVVCDSNGVELALRTGRQATVLASLAMARGTSVSDEIVFDRLWPNGEPRHAVASLRNVVAELRRMLGPAAVTRTGNGYRLDVSTCRLDVDLFRSLVNEARRRVRDDDRAGALTCLDDALALIRGRPFGAVGDESWALPAVAAIDDDIARAEEFWTETRLQLGQIDREIERLRRAARARPHREVRWTQLVRALNKTSRRAEALRALAEARTALAEYGLRPGPDLLGIERAIIGEPLASDRLIPIRRDTFVGRAAPLAQLVGGAPLSWVVGDSGLGKTRLLAELADRRAERGEATIYVACQRRRDLLLPSLIAQARHRLGLSIVGDSVEPADDPISLHGPVPDGAGRRVRMLAVLADLLLQLGTRTPTTVIVDDVQWLSTDADADVISLVMGSIPGIGWVFAGRPTERGLPANLLYGELSRAGGISTITLDPFVESELATLAALESPGLGDDSRSALVNEVLRSTQGNPLFAAELIRHRTDATYTDGVPPRLEAIVGATIGQLSVDELHVIELLAAAGSAVMASILGRASRIDTVELFDLLERLRGEGLIAAPYVDAVDFRHELLRDAVAANVSPARISQRRLQIIDALRSERDHLPLCAELFVTMGVLADADMIAERNDAVTRALDLLVSNGEFGPAIALAQRYLDLDSTHGSRLDSTPARVNAARVLIACGESRRGTEALLEMLDSIRTLDDPKVHADALLAFGPSATGSRMHGDSFLDEAVAVAARLPVDDVARQVQLRCWIAHHRLNIGERDEVVADIDDLIDSLAGEPDGRWLGLALAVRAQADTLAEASPDDASLSAARLRTFTRRTADAGSNAAEAILRVGEAFATGTLDDVLEAKQLIEAVAERLPRPDLRWWAHAVEASITIASKGRSESEEAIARAEEIGRRLGVDLARSVALSQRLLVTFQAAALGDFAESLRLPAAAPDANSALLATYGLASLAVDDRPEADRIAKLLSARPAVLSSSGPSWPLTALFATELASAVSDRDLAVAVRSVLSAHHGRGLSMNGLVYVGTADRLLGMIAHTVGESDGAARLLAGAARQEKLRHAHTWVALTRRTSAALRLN